MIVKKILSLTYLMSALFIVAVIGIIVASPSKVHAANASDFNPGRIIDDVVFYNSGAMSVEQIQTFLNSKVTNCDTNGTQPASDWGYPNLTHAQLAQYKREGSHGFSQDSGFHAPPYTCLRNYSQATPQMEAASSYCNALASGNRTSAQIIKDVAVACGINPQVLIILLEKEQSLVTDKWPLQRQFQKATGFACPDTAPCNPSYAGFFYQVYNAARQFKVYKGNPNNYNYIAGRTNRIYWNPDTARCGSSEVYITNQATAALYIYTPYRPNQAALNNLYGTGDSCSAYGNRNFWRIFTDWFGSTTIKLPFQGMDRPRWMRLKADTYKKDLLSANKSNIDWQLSSGQQIYFTSKITIDGITYLRSQYDSERNENKGIPESAIEEVPINYVSMEQPRWMKATQNVRKLDPVTERDQTNSTTSTGIEKDRWIYVASKVEIGGKLYLRSQYDTLRNLQTGIRDTQVEDVTPTYVELERPRGMMVTKQTEEYDLRDTATSTNTPISQGSIVYLTHKIKINEMYYATNGQPANDTYTGIPLSDLRDIETSDITLLSGQRAYRVTETLTKLDVKTGLPEDAPAVAVDTKVFFQGSITIDNKTYLRSAYDTEQGKTTVIPIDKLEVIPITFQAMQTPRSFRLTKDAHKVDPVTKRELDILLRKGTVIAFNQKIIVDGVEYLRTAYDSSHDDYKGIPSSILAEL